MICKCNREVKLRHPRVNRCRCGMSYDRNGTHIGGQYDGSKVKIAATDSASTADATNSRYANKPGSALESLIPKWAVQEKEECSCKSMKLKMDRMGSVECSKRIEEIVQHLLQQDKKLIPVLQSVPKSLQRAAATKLVKKAIKLSEK